MSRNEPKAMDDWDSINWLTSNNSGEHFWTQSNSVQNFAVLENEHELVNCPAAPVASQDAPLLCEFFLVAAGTTDTITDYIYFAYTTNSFAIINLTNDRWMPTN